MYKLIIIEDEQLLRKNIIKKIEWEKYGLQVHHGAINYGHIGADIITLAAILRIPVCMHNVSEDRIFRPSTWNAFGTTDKEGADYRACENFGPLYGKK